MLVLVLPHIYNLTKETHFKSKTKVKNQHKTILKFNQHFGISFKATFKLNGEILKLILSSLFQNKTAATTKNAIQIKRPQQLEWHSGKKNKTEPKQKSFFFFFGYSGPVFCDSFMLLFCDLVVLLVSRENWRFYCQCFTFC